MFARKAGMVMVIASAVGAACALVLLAGLFAVSPGSPRPYVDADGKPLAGSISEKVFVDIGGARQGMFIKGTDVRKPVLLYLHGGMPDYFLAQTYPTGLEDRFVVCWWEQRGSGMSYAADLPTSTISTAQLLSDTYEVTDYLRKRFGRDKVYLMGHSGGTYLGIQAAASRPELYHAYIGVAQMSDQLRSEKRAYDYMLAEYRRRGDRTMAARLEAAPVTMEHGTPGAYLKVRDAAMHRLGVGTMRQMRSVETGLFLRSFACRDYTLGEKVGLWRGKFRGGVSILFDDMKRTDLAETVPEVPIPVYFFHGAFDHTCSYEESKAYFERLKAPVKGFYTFEESAHSPMFEEPVKMGRIIDEDVLRGENGLADPS